jgi:hypothetical protein
MQFFTIKAAYITLHLIQYSPPPPTTTVAAVYAAIDLIDTLNFMFTKNKQHRCLLRAVSTR